MKNFKKLLLIILFLSLFLPLFSLAEEAGQKVIFYVDKNYDALNRERIFAILIKSSQKGYFYVDDDYWGKLSTLQKEQIANNYLSDLAYEFDNKIYPVLTSTFGFEPKPGIDNDEKITILLHQMKKDAGGYYNTGDIYSKYQNPKSNQREMVYLNTNYLSSSIEKSFLAHEFSHLITINQKNLLRGVDEETWLNEARSEYSATLLGYDNVYEGSNLEVRVRDFLAVPSNPLTFWQDTKGDYATVNLFTQYLVSHYGKKILVDSLHSDKVGIESINEALTKNNYKDSFEDIFGNWIITLLVNDCALGEKFCYLRDSLKDLRISPAFYFLPKSETILSTYHQTTYWQPNWHRLIGGSENLTLEFDGEDSKQFKVPYVLCGQDNQCQVNFLALDQNQKGKIAVSNFNSKYNSLTLMPFIFGKTSGFNGKEESFSFLWKVSVEEKTPLEETELINQLLIKIEQLKKQIAEYQAKISALLAQEPNQNLPLCQKFNNDLSYGMMQNQEVKCLQEFLKNQGPEIYPEGLITGNFLSLTKSAVIRFQEKHALEILLPLGLEKGTGYVGSFTRAKINQLLK